MPNLSSRRVLELLGLIVLAILSATIYAHQPVENSPQVRMNAKFVNAPSLSEALDAYRPTRPPLYPIVVRALTQLGFPIGAVNPLFFAGLLGWVWHFSHRTGPGLSPLFPVSLIALAHFNYPMLATLTSELMFTCIAALWISALTRHLRAPGATSLVVLAALTALACATRYVGFFWLLPLATLHLLARPRLPVGQRVREAVALVALSLAPVSLWMLKAYTSTGFVSGRDRFSLRENVYRSDLQGIDNWLLTGVQYTKTMFVDFFSSRTWASHEVVDSAYAAHPVEWLVAALAIATLLASAAVLLRRSAEGADPRTRLVRFAADRSEPALLAQTTLMFVVAIFLLWAVGNNDRLYSRFLYPSYPFALLLGFVLYWKVTLAAARSRLRVPFVVLYVLMMGLHLVRDAWVIRGG